MGDWWDKKTLEEKRKVYSDMTGLIKKNAWSVIKKYPYADYSDLCSEGNVGLVEAAQRFDPSNNVKFSTYAYHRIKGQMLDFLKKNPPLTHYHLAPIIYLRQIYEGTASEPVIDTDESNEPAGTPSAEGKAEIADDTQAITLSVKRTSDCLIDENTPETALASRIEEGIVTDAIKELDANYREVIRLYYYKGLDYMTIACILKIPDGTVRTWLKRSKETLKIKLRSRGF